MKDIVSNQRVMANRFVELGDKELVEVVGGKNMLSYLFYSAKPIILFPGIFK